MTVRTPVGGGGWAALARDLSASAAVLLGLTVLALAVGNALSDRDPAGLTAWLGGLVGPGFLAPLAALLLIGVLAVVRLERDPRSRVWLRAGTQAASAIATLALTFTLFGISAGIGLLAGQELSPATVQGAVAGLTDRFRLAFATTVIGLPLSAALRAAVLLAAARDNPPAGRQG